MRSLSDRDVRAFNQAVLELHATESVADFPWQIHRAVRAMMGGDIVVVDWINPRTSVSLSCQYFPGQAITEELNAIAHVLLPSQSPFWLRCADDPHSVSDFMTFTQWSQRDFFWVLREAAQEECLCLDVRLTPSLTLMLVDVRGTYGSHVAAERLKLKLLGPHVRQVYRRLVAGGQMMAGRRPVLRQAQVNVEQGGQKCHWSKESRALLGTFGIRVIRDTLPKVVREWFLEQRSSLERPSEVSAGTKPLRLERPGRTLSIYAMRSRDEGSYRLILQEKDSAADPSGIIPGFDLSQREAEVLRWLAQGKTNAEIALILDISPGTVRRHLENIFPKLGVDNRHAASLLVAQIEAVNLRRATPR